MSFWIWKKVSYGPMRRLWQDVKFWKCQVKEIWLYTEWIPILKILLLRCWLNILVMWKKERYGIIQPMTKSSKWKSILWKQFFCILNVKLNGLWETEIYYFAFKVSIWIMDQLSLVAFPWNTQMYLKFQRLLECIPLKALTCLNLLTMEKGPD